MGLIFGFKILENEFEINHFRSKGNNPSTMTTCQYYIKRTKTPRICAKKSSHTKSSFLGGVCPPFTTGFGLELHLCHNHFGMIVDKIRKKIGIGPLIDFQQGRGDNSVSRDYKLAQLISILTQHIDEFNRFTQASRNPVSSVPGADDVLFIEEKTENQVLASKFEQAKRDGRYIDLTELPEQKSEVVELQLDCPVCLDTFSPRNMAFLQCAHTICTDCFSNIVKRNIPQQCPVCRCNF